VNWNSTQGAGRESLPRQCQKLGILLAVCHHPELLFLDEPVSALDPIAREMMLKFLFELLEDPGAPS